MHRTGPRLYFPFDGRSVWSLFLTLKNPPTRRVSYKWNCDYKQHNQAHQSLRHKGQTQRNHNHTNYRHRNPGVRIEPLATYSTANTPSIDLPSTTIDKYISSHWNRLLNFQLKFVLRSNKHVPLLNRQLWFCSVLTDLRYFPFWI